MKLDLSSAGGSLSGLGAAAAARAAAAPSLSEAPALSLEAGGGSGFPICEQVCASSASGLFLASS